MDINKIQKLNDMALNLKKHNVVYSKEDAIKQAENIVREQDNDLRKDVRKLTFALRDALNEISDLKSHVKKLQNELNDVRVNPPTRIIERKVVHDVPVEKEVKEEAKPIVQQQKLNNEPRKDINLPIDRNGIAPSEVSVEKFFYFGEK